MVVTGSVVCTEERGSRLPVTWMGASSTWCGVSADLGAGRGRRAAATAFGGVAGGSGWTRRTTKAPDEVRRMLTGRPATSCFREAPVSRWSRLPPVRRSSSSRASNSRAVPLCRAHCCSAGTSGPAPTSISSVPAGSPASAIGSAATPSTRHSRARSSPHCSAPGPAFTAGLLSRCGAVPARHPDASGQPRTNPVPAPTAAPVHHRRGRCRLQPGR